MKQASLIFTNGTIHTMAEPETATAIAVSAEGRILAVGDDSQVLALAGAGTKTFNLEGKTLIPGFFDCHLHPLWLGINLGHVDVSPPAVRTKEEIIRRLRERLKTHPKQACIQGTGYDQNALPGAAHITRYELDQVTTTLPVRLVHTSGHAAVVNSKALELLGFHKNTPNPNGGEIIRDERGEPTGVLLEEASWSHLERLEPEMTALQAEEALERANRYLLARGITSATDANTPLKAVAWYEKAVYSGRLTVRVNSMIDWSEVMEAGGEIPTPRDLQPIVYGVSGSQYHVGQAKLFSDGAITTRTCWLHEPFEGMPQNYGIAMHPVEELNDYIMTAHEAGWQIAVHAIGDRAIEEVLNAYAEAQRRVTRPRPGHRIEHCMLLNEEQITRLRRQNIWSIGQPEFISRLGDAYVLALGEERVSRLSPYATLDRESVAQAFSSDNPVVPGAPLEGLRAAMQRRTPSGRVLNAKECVSAEVALYAYTTAPAYATRTQKERGTLEAGKWADITVLSADPLTTPLSEWEQVQVTHTFVGGVCRFGE
jgi:predicted amidohydrolase YtcJ